VRFLAVSGSLRAASTNTALLRAMVANAPSGQTVELFDRLADIPIFNPDRQEGETPEAVADLARRLGSADGLIISSPEYAHGLPGGLKNAFDWLVGGYEAAGKPAMLVHASSRSAISRAQLREVLKTMALRLFDGDEFELPLLGKSEEAMAIMLAEPANAARMTAAMAGFAAFVDSLPKQEPRSFTLR
jgi:NAD(P)H-dependent FMN reductase